MGKGLGKEEEEEEDGGSWRGAGTLSPCPQPPEQGRAGPDPDHRSWGRRRVTSGAMPRAGAVSPR